jgi:hypothetical protein
MTSKIGTGRVPQRNPVPVSDLAGASIDPESKSSLHDLQARAIASRCAVSATMAIVLAPFCFGGLSS